MRSNLDQPWNQPSRISKSYKPKVDRWPKASLENTYLQKNSVLQAAQPPATLRLIKFLLSQSTSDIEGRYQGYLLKSSHDRDQSQDLESAHDVVPRSVLFFFCLLTYNCHVQDRSSERMLHFWPTLWPINASIPPPFQLSEFRPQSTVLSIPFWAGDDWEAVSSTSLSHITFWWSESQGYPRCRMQHSVILTLCVSMGL